MRPKKFDVDVARVRSLLRAIVPQPSQTCAKKKEGRAAPLLQLSPTEGGAEQAKLSLEILCRNGSEEEGPGVQFNTVPKSIPKIVPNSVTVQTHIF